jgi:hypothetical protein
MTASERSNNYIKRRGPDMKTIKTISGILTLTLLVTLSMSLMVVTADAQGHSYHVNPHHGMSAIVEKELRAKEQKTDKENKDNVASIAAKAELDAEKEKEYSYASEDEE